VNPGRRDRIRIYAGVAAPVESVGPELASLRVATSASAAAIDGLLDSQALAALGAATSEHLAASTGGHARAETVGALTFNFAGLISTLHAGISTMS